MKKIYITKFLLVLSLAVVASCSKLDGYLDKEPSSSQSYVSTINDCNLLLHNYQLIGGFDHTLFLDDCIGFDDFTAIERAGSALYNEYVYWTDTKYIYAPNEDDKGWNGFYSNIYYMNIILDNIDKVAGNDEALRSQYKGEAYLGRAFYHFMAVNTYSKEYNPSTASSDLGVPYVKDCDTQGKRTRGTVQDVYDNAIADIEAALEYLKNTKPESGRNQRGNIAAAYSLLSKIYLHEQNWDLAAQYASKSLDIYGSLINYNDYCSYDEYFASINFDSFKNIEQTYLRSGIQTMATFDLYLAIEYGFYQGGMFLSSDFLSIINQDNDLRYRFFMGHDPISGKETILEHRMSDSFRFAYVNCGLSTTETYLILAEAYARSGNITEACNTLNTFLRTRYDRSSFEPFSSTDKSAVIEKIVNEKTIEFVITGNRWYEMRRLNVLGEYDKTVIRTDAKGNVIGTMKASPVRMVIPIPGKLTDINPAITPNPFE